MPKYQDVLGFNDRWLLILGIPLLGFLTPIIYLGIRLHRAPYYTWPMFFISTAITLVFWMGNRTILILLRRKYPLFEQSRKRITITGLVMLLFTLVAANCNGITPPFWETNGYAGAPDLHVLGVMNTIAVASIYEVIYYMQQLRLSVNQQEVLKSESLMAQIKALKSQVDPHFLFNNLNTLSTIVHEDPKQAEKFIQQLARLYRYILEMPETTLITLKEELDLLEAYVYLSQTRFGESLKVLVNIPASYHQKKIIPFALQILVENAIKHNIVSITKPLSVVIDVADNKLIISNNLQKKQSLVPSTGKGLKNIDERIRLLQDQELKYITTMDYFIVTLPLFAES